MIIAGVDEVGRGPLAGPVVAACVILPDDYQNPQIIDSKQISHSHRVQLYREIQENAVNYAVAELDNIVVDEINILQATHKAMVMAVEMLKIKPDFVYIDGNSIPKTLPYKAEAVVKGDTFISQISAASIMAKVHRDNWMTNVAHELYPQYNFAKHKGYATREHFDAIAKYGICPLHRMTFLKKFFSKQISLF
ncbi:MAG: ribonuclease HII [Ignavibacteriae bacterium HGW-Ignavibacteriae-1]|jgi:ribonuclease HII|nr:MAG: ribonuclease HII [Ignavibacteriae bacterium HGW-Ignavibacteriae-1]